jgi:hypothetical protein
LAPATRFMRCKAVGRADQTRDLEPRVHDMFYQHPILFEWLRATGVFALLIIAGAISVDLLLTNGWQWGAAPASGSSILAGTW